MNASTARCTARRSAAAHPVRQSVPQAAGQQAARRQWFGARTEARRNEVVARAYAANRIRIAAYLLRLGVPAADVDDVCAEVFAVVLRRLSTYNGTSALSTWLFGIARKLASDYRGSARARRETLVDSVPEHGLDEGPLAALTEARQRATVRCAVAALRPGPRLVVTRFMLDEQSMDEVARELKVPLQTAYSRLYSGQASLRLALRD